MRKPELARQTVGLLLLIAVAGAMLAPGSARADAAAPPSQQETVSVSAYRDRLRDLESAVRDAANARQSGAARRVSSALGKVDGVRVEFPDGRVVEPDHGWLRSIAAPGGTSGANQADWQQAARRVQAELAAIDAGSPDDVPSDDELKAILKRVMGEKQFEADAAKRERESREKERTDSNQASRKSGADDSEDRGSRGIASGSDRSPNVRRWGRGSYSGGEPTPPSDRPAFELPTFDFGGAGVAIVWIIGAVLVAAVIAAIIYVVYQLWLNRAPRRAVTTAAAAAKPTATPEASALDKDLPGWFAEADALAAEGRFREAFRAIYLALLGHLHRLRLVDYRKGRTNWETVRTFAGATDSRDELRHLTRSFDFVWYGNTPQPQPEFAAARSSVENMVRSVAAP